MVRYENMVRGTFLRRPNRFIAEVEIAGKIERCHVKNTGRCRELLKEGTEVWCQHSPSENRKTAYSLITACKGGLLVNIDSQVPNRLASDWVRAGGLGFVPAELRAEVRYGESRLDLAFTRPDGVRGFAEVKGVTLEDGGFARFPDAPTERGAKHLRELMRAAAEGSDANLIFIVQMAGIRSLSPNRDTDPVFSETLARAAQAGVHIFGVGCTVTEDTIATSYTVPIVLA